jgi:serine/threonine protein kinase
MARSLSAGDKLKGGGGLTVSAIVTSQGQATSYAAVRKDGMRVFLKQAKTPSVRQPWFESFISYQNELHRRCASDHVSKFVYRHFHTWVEGRCLYQSFEFLDAVEMAEVLTATKYKKVSSAQKFILAKVLAAGVAAIAEEGVVHADLKPENVLLIPDSGITAGFRLRLIDMDFSLLSDQLAPWHAHVGYFGTPRYFSPEHIAGETPTPASDAFTTTIIVREILEGQHPYGDVTADQYRELVARHQVAKVKLPRGLLPHLGGKVHQNCIEEALIAGLDPAEENRPTAAELNSVLNGGEACNASKTPSFHESGALVLLGDLRPLRCNLSSQIGRNCLRVISSDYRLYGKHQFTVSKSTEAGGWTIKNVLDKPAIQVNSRVLNRGEELALSSGDVITVGHDTADRGRLLVSFSSAASV